MNHIKSYDQLFEAKQVGLLYHYTSVVSLMSILRNDELWADRYSKSVSLTRNKLFHVTPGYGISTQARFIIDGDKLSQRYEINPYAQEAEAGVNSWKGDPDNIDSGLHEFEERVTGSIKPLSKYIVGIEINDNISKNRTVLSTIDEIENTFGVTVGRFYIPKSYLDSWD